MTKTPTMPEPAHDKPGWSAHGTRVALPDGTGGFDVRNCPDPEALASFIADTMNKRFQMEDRISQLDFCYKNQLASTRWAKNVLKRMRDGLVNIHLDLKRQPDQVTFASTNHADQFGEIVEELERIEEWRIVEGEEPPRDWIAELEVASSTNHILRKALMTAQRQETELRGDLAYAKKREAELLLANNRYLEGARAARALLRAVLKTLKGGDGKIGFDIKIEVAGDADADAAQAIEKELENRISSWR